ncbi:hypothetical protein ACOSRT_003800, partial [Providencia stuartii]
SAFGGVFLIFGETIITAPFAVYFLYRKDQHALVTIIFKFDINSVYWLGLASLCVHIAYYYLNLVRTRYVKSLGSYANTGIGGFKIDLRCLGGFLSF